ncbi:MAG: hypothetical protein F2667_07790 [Actinobacteria bacterium]|uniref:Unannotated protein n=1 Tax=freshwater metagenome TaxID=449393 RepID=A0A6J6QRE7_9ZZZZ|nr:hypothetical protein [Actinomycetota bacterium]
MKKPIAAVALLTAISAASVTAVAPAVAADYTTPVPTVASLASFGDTVQGEVARLIGEVNVGNILPGALLTSESAARTRAVGHFRLVAKLRNADGEVVNRIEKHRKARPGRAFTFVTRNLYMVGTYRATLRFIPAKGLRLQRSKTSTTFVVSKG